MEENLRRKLSRNDEPDVLTDSLTGSILCNPDLGLLDYGNVIVRKDYQSINHVLVISGMGTGHEPTPVGFVGGGMLDAVIVGRMFTSPPTREILRTLKELTFKSDQGVLLVVGNNTGESLNFGLAAERAKNDGIRVKTLIVCDDCCRTGRFKQKRCLVGVVLIYKIAGAMAESGKTLNEIYEFCSEVMKEMVSISVCLKSCSSPTVETCICTKLAPQNEVQLGAGLNGEPGVKKLRPSNLDDLCASLLNEMTDPNSLHPFELDSVYPVVLVINNLGTATKMEETLFAQKFSKLLLLKNVKIIRILTGRYLTILDTYGFSVTLMKIMDPLTLAYLDAPCKTTSWSPIPAQPFNTQSYERIATRVLNHRLRRKKALRGPKLSTFAMNVVFLVIQFACNALISCELQLNRIDAELGDGDAGSQLKNGCEALLAELESGRLKTTHPFTFLEYVSKILEVTVGGAAGFLYGILFEAAAGVFSELEEDFPVTELTWLNSLETAKDAIKLYTNADERCRTMYAPLNACAVTVNKLLNSGGKAMSAFSKGVLDAEIAAEKTRQPLNEYPDAGAHAVGIWLRAVFEGVKLRYEDDDTISAIYVDSTQSNAMEVAKSVYCSPFNPHESIRKLVSLLKNPITKSHEVRQKEILDDFIQACGCAFWLCDLTPVSQVMEMLAEDPEKLISFRNHMEVLLKFAAVPPMMERPSEILERIEDLQQYFTFFGCLLVTLHDPGLQELTFKALHALLSEETKGLECSIRASFRRKAAEESQLTEFVGKLMEFAEDELYARLLTLSTILAEISISTCQILVNVGVIRYVIERLDPEWLTRDILDESVPYSEDSLILNFDQSCILLWRLLDSIKLCSRRIMSESKYPDKKGLWSLRYAFRILTKRQGAKLDRNSLLSIILQLLSLFPDMPHFHAGLAQDIAILCVQTELGTKGTWAENVHISTSDIDYEFKKMLIFAICYSTKCFAMDKVYCDHKIVLCLLKILTQEGTLKWSLQQQCKLNLVTLTTLNILVSLVPQEMDKYNVPTKILKMLHNIRDRFDHEILIAALQLLYSLLQTKDKQFFQTMRDEEAITTLTEIATKILDRPSLKTLDQRCLAYTFHVLHSLYETLKTPHLSSVALTLAYMDRSLHPRDEDVVVDPSVMVSMLDFLWESVVWHERNLKEFISNGGVYKLLDVMQEQSYPVKLMALGILVDLTEEGSCIPNLITWRGGGVKFVPMMLRVFREENERLGVKCTKEGAIEDIEAPLMGEQQWYETFCMKGCIDSSPATADMFCSCRPKIYALIHLLTNRNKELHDLANECYQMANDKLGLEDQITMLLVENFLALKLLEVWVEVDRDVKQSGFRPVRSDSQLLQTLCHRFYLWSLHIKRVQTGLVKAHQKEDDAAEKYLYKILADSRLCDSLCALREMCYIARTTEQMFRLTAKMRHRKQVDKNLIFSDEEAEHHRTYIRNLGTTAVFNQTVSASGIKSSKSQIIHTTKPFADVSDLKSMSLMLTDKGEDLL